MLCIDYPDDVSTCQAHGNPKTSTPSFPAQVILGLQTDAFIHPNVIHMGNPNDHAHRITMAQTSSLPHNSRLLSSRLGSSWGIVCRIHSIWFLHGSEFERSQFDWNWHIVFHCRRYNHFLDTCPLRVNQTSLERRRKFSGVYFVTNTRLRICPLLSSHAERDQGRPDKFDFLGHYARGTNIVRCRDDLVLSS